MAELVLTETRGAISLLTFNRPEKLNALNYALIDRLMQILDQIEDDASVHAVIVTGAGDRAFSAGGDIHEFSESIKQGPDAALKAFVRRGQAMTSRLEVVSEADHRRRQRNCIRRRLRDHRSRPSGGRQRARARLPSPKSTSEFRRPLAGRSACRASQGESGPWSFSSPETPSPRNGRTRSGSSIAWCSMSD